ncbi:FAD:protein FMN transferase [Edaphobacter sp.]|uniref:FAD:protein FMN transferase n=1 Tax=Edaphobacter sp. TaxID=1934404 RepID=UPI002DBA916E|nr:FAD:protein FMN transferase [Edaphobacter sp.]HEU5342570.1 FAD:protein FMN transferase [Edaphobacter sp.]
MLTALLSPPLAAQPALQRFHQTHAAMGTVFTIDLYAPSETSAETAMNSAFNEIDRLEALLSNYRPSSELSRISREAGSGPVVTDPETFRFLTRSVYWSRVSGGAFDITVGPLLRAWGFFFHQGHVPPQSELDALKDKIGWQHIALDPATRSVSFTQHQPMELDPGSIGKGFAVESVEKLLRAQGITSAFIDAGGSTLYAIGAIPGAAGWPVDVPDPQHPGKIASTIQIRDTSLSTGACTQKFFIQNGHRYCHIFDPRTMRPVEGVLQTTVIDPSATDSDALSTVVFVLNPAASQRLLSTMPKVQALIFTQTSCTAIHWKGQPCNQSQARQKGPQPHD